MINEEEMLVLSRELIHGDLKAQGISQKTMNKWLTSLKAFFKEENISVYEAFLICRSFTQTVYETTFANEDNVEAN